MAKPGQSGSSTRRSVGTKGSSGPLQGGGVTLKGSRQAANPKGDGQGKVTPLAAKAPPVKSPKVIGTKGRTVAGKSAAPGSAPGTGRIKSS